MRAHLELLVHARTHIHPPDTRMEDEVLCSSVFRFLV